MTAQLMQGRIVKALSGFYYVQSGEQRITCRARGKFRYQKQTPLVGDQVEITLQADGSGVLERILPRKNEFQRPAVSNIDQMIVMASGASPVTDPFLIDRLTCVVEHRGAQPIICINKWDLMEENALFELYRNAGFVTIRLSAETGLGVEELRTQLKGSVSAFAGNSGVGKTSVLNALDPSYQLRVGEVSEKLGRGRHTTRHVEIFELSGGGLIADTPGYAAFDAESMEVPGEKELPYSFREFRPYLGHCRFLNCSHTKETGCAVLEALRAGAIAESRYHSYLRLHEEVKTRKHWK